MQAAETSQETSALESTANVELSKTLATPNRKALELEKAEGSEFSLWWLVPMALVGVSVWWFLSRSSARRERDRKIIRTPLPRISEPTDQSSTSPPEKKGNAKSRKKEKKKNKSARPNKIVKPISQTIQASSVEVTQASNPAEQVPGKKTDGIAAASAQWMESFAQGNVAESTRPVEVSSQQKFVAIFEPLRSVSATSGSASTVADAKQSKRPVSKYSEATQNIDVLRPLRAPIIRTAPPRPKNEPQRYPISSSTSVKPLGKTTETDLEAAGQKSPSARLPREREESHGPQPEQLEPSITGEAGNGAGSGLAAIVAKRLAAKSVNEPPANAKSEN